MSTGSDRVLDDPTDAQLHSLLTEIDYREPHLVLERTGSSGSAHYLRVRMDQRIDPNDGRGYIVEYGGGPGMQFRASVRDNARWGTPHSPALDTVATTVRDWAFQRYGWHDTMMWERVGAER
ncbi:hypothetical protein [Nocardia vermiculata]|uniref:Uncharacterized protein n=1 Tax=Nocardia vermiculata TaxID=257274 RepID=A0A846XXQ1_9NOCA|nr:hypothetical protein [Nocardia vermiculata]NKY51883.1 hypothetical protein [Nocardia vermiculata]